MRASSRSSAVTSRTAVGLAALLLLGGLAGCGDSSASSSGGSDPASGPGSGPASGGETGSRSGASCAAAIRYDGHLYLRWGPPGPGRAPDPTGRTLPAVIPGCDDTGPAGPEVADEPVLVDVLRATDPRIAVGYRGDLYVRQGASPPAGPRWMPNGQR